MKKFAELLNQLDQTTSTLKKTAHLRSYFESDVDEKDKLWTLALFTGKKPPRAINTLWLRKWAAEMAEIPLWLFEQNYHIVGDLAETISLLVSSDKASSETSLHEWIEDMGRVKKYSEKDKEDFVKNAWKNLSSDEVWIFNKIITGGFRLGVSKNLVIQALAQVCQLDTSHVAFRISGNWTPDHLTWNELLDPPDTDRDISKPYPFFLSYSINENDISQIHPDQWAAEYKWDGMRAQLIHRKGSTFIWSRGEELMTDTFPEVHISGTDENFVIDGEIMAWSGHKPGIFADLQPRIARKKVTKNLLLNNPVIFTAYDLMEYNSVDQRQKSLSFRRGILENLVTDLNNEHIRLSPWLPFSDISDLKILRQGAPAQGAEGLMLKKKSGLYHSGRKSGDMFKWKCDPFLVDAVLMYAQRGHGRRSLLYSDFTFGLWDKGQLVPFAKAYSGLTDKEMGEITQFVKKNIIQSFGPVVSVKPHLVFELAFENISVSKRHKSGIAVRFPRIHRWRHDKKAEEANTLEDLINLLPQR